MSLLVWNCHCLGLPRIVRPITKIVNGLRPQVLFLSETKKRAADIERVRVRGGFDACLIVDCVGKSGGLALLWMS